MNDNLTIKIITKQDITCFYLIGQLDAHSAPKLENEIEKVMQLPNNNLLFNLSNLDYISSAGLGVFMSFVQDIREKNGDIKFAELNDKVNNVMDLLGFNHIYDITKTEKEAIDKFTS